MGNPDANKVLDSECGRKLREIERRFDELATAGRPLVFCDDYRTVTNEHFGVEGNRRVRICWVYLTAATLDEKALKASPSLRKTTAADQWLRSLNGETRKMFESRELRKNHLKKFPAFPVFYASPGRIQMLNPIQANALAQYSAFNVVSSAPEIRRAMERK